ncbi:TIGR04255 family protein [Mesorhizobium sp.]|uniref:TIGR04255 family protein n=1 Tax=Mesorhizobium sp. TaxID=1871066 RepID=UPI000FE82BC1|nr:TIGR04255 family protein [Mesorhizobium sp.]RWM08957.1 MAG: TIGR04255 family protein [Mesorhizobium sp.]
MNEKLPKRLKSDAILEAVMEIRFEPDPSLVSEIIFGRFADVDEWRDFRQARLPTADIPAPIRRADPNFRYQPSIEMASADGGVAVRIGPQVVMYAQRGSYPGWDKFGAELDKVITRLYRIIPKVQVSRIGLRYINALRSDAHEVKGIDDLAIGVSVADQKLSNSLNLNFKTNVGTDYETMCRIATVDLAAGNIPEGATVIVDIDVYTGENYSTKDAESVKHWVIQAHDKEKENFFLVLGKEATARLRED